MNNEPVAYGMLTFCKNCGEQNPYAVKELTDEEMIEVWNTFERTNNLPIIDFAKAILRKAQENDKLNPPPINIGGVIYQSGKEVK
jgi:hypothetical protein